MVIDFFMLLLAGIVGGIVGGATAYVFSRNTDSRFSEKAALKPTELRVTSARNQKGVVIEFPPKEIKFSKN